MTAKDSDLAIHGGRPVTTMSPRLSTIGQEELQAATGVLEAGTLSEFRGGPQVRKFEQAFADYVGATYAVATTSGTTALHASVAALELQPTDEVLVPAMTFVSTASVVMQEGAKVVFVDIDDNYCMDVDDLAAKVTPNSKAIIPVHLYGRATRMDAIMELAAKHDLRVIEDACQSHGAVFRGKKTGNLGDVGCFSFYETKNMTCGEGGMITTSDEALYTQLCLRREHGSPRGGSTWYDYQKLGYNYNMTELQGAIGLVQLGKLDSMNDARIQNAALYDTHLADSGLVLPPPTDGVNVYHNYPVLLPVELRDKRDFFVEAMRAEGIAIDVAYPCTLYQTELFKKAGIDGHCPRAEDISSRIVTLFTDKSIDEAAISSTAQAAKKVLTYLRKNHDSAQ